MMSRHLMNEMAVLRPAAHHRSRTRELTAAAEAAFRRLRDAAMTFDRQARSGVSAEHDELCRLLARLHDNARAIRTRRPIVSS